MAKKQAKNYIDAIIPTRIFENTSLSDGAKVFYGVVLNMANKEGYAFAGTRYFANLLSRSTRSIQYYISELSELKLVRVNIVNGQRRIYPDIYPKDNNDLFIIPGEILSSSISSAVKLSYGQIQYKSANKNGYFAYNSIDAIAELIGKSASTARRHLKAFMKLRVVKLEKVDQQTKIYTFNSYQTTFKNKLSENLRKYTLDPPDKVTDPEYRSSITPDVEQKLRALVGR